MNKQIAKDMLVLLVTVVAKEVGKEAGKVLARFLGQPKETQC